MKKTNPYNFKLPVQEDMFYGRVEERDNIVRNLLKFPGDSVAIVGGRRIGKTCLLEAIRRSLENLLSFEQVDLIPIPIFIKLSGEIPSSSHALFSHIGNETQLILGRWLGQDFLKFTDISQVTEPAPIIRHFLIEWSELLSKHIERRFRLILLLDECEQIVKQTWATEIYSGLYYLLSDEATNSLFKVVMAGSHHFYTQVQQNGSHLKDILDYHTLNTFDLDATKSLINVPTGAALSEELIELIVSASGGHPYLIQYVMQNLWDLDLSNITLAKVNQIISEFPRKRNNFMDWVNDLSEESLRNIPYSFNGGKWSK